MDLDELERLARAATQGQWKLEPCGEWIFSEDAGSDDIICDIPAEGDGSRQAWLKHNAAYIAARHPQAILELIALARRKEG